MRYVLLPINGGEDRLFTMSLVSPQWVWWVAHAALGMTVGMVAAVALRRFIVPRRTATARRELQTAA
jgi:hypothetical protein